MSISQPALSAISADSLWSAHTPCITASLMAAKSDIRTPLKPICSLNTSLISLLLTVVGIPSIVLNDVITIAAPASIAALYAGI